MQSQESLLMCIKNIEICMDAGVFTGNIFHMLEATKMQTEIIMVREFISYTTSKKTTSLEAKMFTQQKLLECMSYMETNLEKIVFHGKVCNLGVAIRIKSDIETLTEFIKSSFDVVPQEPQT